MKPYRTITLLLAAATAVLAGCMTVVPEPVAVTEASFGDTGKQNGGFLGFVAGGALIDDGAHARYNALIELYGKEFLPALERDHGVKQLATAWFISNEAFHKFETMNAWKHMGRPPKK